MPNKVKLIVTYLSLFVALLAGEATSAQDQSKSPVNQSDRMSVVGQILRQASRAAAAIPARDGFHVFPSRAFKNQAHADIAAIQAKIGDSAGAYQTAAACEDAVCQAYTLKAIGKMQAKVGYQVQAALTFHSALQLVPEIQLKSRAYFLESIAIAQGQSGEVNAAMQTIATFSESDKARPLGEIASAQAKAGDVRGGLQTTEMIKKPYYQYNALLNIALLQAKTGDREGARVAIQEALEATANITCADWRFSALQKAALVQVEAGDGAGAAMTLNRALQFVASYQPNGNRHCQLNKDYAFSSVASTQVKVGDVKGAFQTADSLQGNSKNIVLAAIARAQAETGDVKGALQTMDYLQGGSEDRHLKRSKEYALKAIAEALAKAGDVNRAIQTMDKLPEGIGKDIMVAIVSAQIKLGDLQAAIQTAASIDDAVSRVKSLTAIAAAQIEAGERANATITLYQAQNKAITIRIGYSGHLQSYRKKRVIRDLAFLQMKSGNLPAALEMIDKFGGRFKAQTLRKLAAIRAQAGTGEIRSALEWAAEQERNDHKAMIFLGVAEGILEQKGALVKD
ncbi:MAG: hypothetical protein ACYS0I_07825 [Planctomycetota bacterium]|jgi:tetratricopeptide (TPR) repeat protein